MDELSLDMDIGSAFAHEILDMHKVGEVILQTGWTNRGGAMANANFTKGGRVFPNPILSNTTSQYYASEILKAVFGRNYRKDWRLSVKGNWNRDGTTQKEEREVLEALNSMAENGRNQMWILICEYGIPEYRDSINPSSRSAAQVTHTELLYGVSDKRDSNYYLGGVVLGGNVNGEEMWESVGNSWYEDAKKGEFLAPYWLNSVTKYRPFHLDYDQDPEQNFNTWKDTEFLGQSDTLLGITLWTATQREESDGLGVFNWWW
tara:strand:- start:2033 stop:2815 length:783 start_codon:yes stop_codon:yes gene_type:complete